MNLSIWSVHWDEAKKFKYFLKLIKDVQKKVDDKRFVGKTGKVSLKKPFLKTKHQPRAGNDSQCMYEIQYSRNNKLIIKRSSILTA